ncbi:hypothetical protein SDC9_86286 [bioreactor metagenome]|uniref:Uncharacterized protein n=1 Tax=bioreactor metagenome TaxID=1076179 RepID=A0A644ZFJ2_9ZZZZ
MMCPVPILPHVGTIIDIDLKAIWTILAIYSKNNYALENQIQ